MALLEALSGHIGGAGRAVVSPGKMSPHERRSAAERLGIKEDSLSSKLLDVATNPAVLVGLALTLRFPVPTAENIALFSNKVSNLAKKIPMLRGLFDVSTNFAGTAIPAALEKLVVHAMTFAETHNNTVKDAVEAYKKTAGVRLTESVATKIAAHLDGLNLPGSQVWRELRSRYGAVGLTDAARHLSGPERDLLSRIRSSYDAGLKEFLSAAKSTDIRDAQKLLKSIGVEIPDSIGYIKNFFPHSLIRRPYDSLLTGEELVKTLDAFGKKGQVYRTTAATAAGRPSGSLMQRTGAALPDPDRLLSHGLIDERTAAALRAEAERAARPFYDLDLMRATSKYNYGLARTRAWMLPLAKDQPPIGQILLEEYQKLKYGPQRDPHLASMLEQKILPMASGQLTPKQAAASEAWDATRAKAADLLDKIPGIPDDLRKALTKPLRDPGSLRYGQVGGSIAKWLYAGTLGSNLAPPIKNLSQQLLTVAEIGPEATADGMKIVGKRMPRVFELLKGKPFNADTLGEAIERAFPEFHTTGFDVRSEVTASLQALVEKEGLRLPTTFGNTMEAVQKNLLLPFTTSERANRLVAFYGMRAKALRELPGTTIIDPLTRKEVRIPKTGAMLETYASQAADFVTRKTQFGGGLMGSPYALLDTWAPWRQFLSFPTKLLGYGLNASPGTLGRMALYGGLAYEGAKALTGADISQALVAGGLPSPRETGPFAPFPFVPPLAQLLGAGALDFAKGEFKELPRSLPMLIPGGVGLSRAASMLPGGVGKYLGKPYADYEHRTPDGRIPVYTPTGAVQGFYTPLQLAARGLGLGDIQGDQERAWAEYLVKQRDEIRSYRTAYLQALSVNDPRSARSIEQDFAARYPEAGPLQVKRNEIDAMQFRRSMPRLQRIMQTMPENVRQGFQAALSTSMAASGEQFLGVHPSVLAGAPSQPARLARPYAPAALAGPGASARQGESAQMATQLGEQTRDEMTHKPFEGY